MKHLKNYIAGTFEEIEYTPVALLMKSEVQKCKITELHLPKLEVTEISEIFDETDMLEIAEFEYDTKSEV